MLKIQKFTHNPFSENSYLVYNEQKNAVLVDPGNYLPHETQAIEDFILNNELTVKKIILTHAHIDHVLGLQWAVDRFKLPVMMHPLEKEILDRNPMSAQQFGFQFNSFVGDIVWIKEGEELKLDDSVAQVYWVPGHSPGSVAYHFAEQNWVISGDALFAGSIGRTDLYKGNHQQLLESIRSQLFILNPETEVFSGHGDSTTIGFEKSNNPFF